MRSEGVLVQRRLQGALNLASSVRASSNFYVSGCDGEDNSQDLLRSCWKLFLRWLHVQTKCTEKVFEGLTSCEGHIRKIDSGEIMT